ncbi:uncharacterized protein LOC143907261 isoform X1 [Temnothorax americanus]|uniref:uncharacterized protein LOC143907261 isoform X1 n=1 Tax=Temnothorax americanus TaxID=1964332 RepID=UPI004068874D
MDSKGLARAINHRLCHEPTLYVISHVSEDEISAVPTLEIARAGIAWTTFYCESAHETTKFRARNLIGTHRGYLDRVILHPYKSGKTTSENCRANLSESQLRRNL